MSLVLPLVLALTATEPEPRTRHLTCTMTAAKRRPFRVSVGESRVTLNGRTYKAVFEDPNVMWVQERTGGGGYYLVTLGRAYRRITITPMKDGRTPQGRAQLGTCKPFVE